MQVRIIYSKIDFKLLFKILKLMMIKILKLNNNNHKINNKIIKIKILKVQLLKLLLKMIQKHFNYQFKRHSLLMLNRMIELFF